MLIFPAGVAAFSLARSARVCSASCSVMTFFFTSRSRSALESCALAAFVASASTDTDANSVSLFILLLGYGLVNYPTRIVGFHEFLLKQYVNTRIFLNFLKKQPVAS